MAQEDTGDVMDAAIAGLFALVGVLFIVGIVLVGIAIRDRIERREVIKEFERMLSRDEEI